MMTLMDHQKDQAKGSKLSFLGSHGIGSFLHFSFKFDLSECFCLTEAVLSRTNGFAKRLCAGDGVSNLPGQECSANALPTRGGGMSSGAASISFHLSQGICFQMGFASLERFVKLIWN